MPQTALKRSRTRSGAKDGKTIVSRRKTPRKAKIVPLEEVEAKIFHQWLWVHQIPHTHIANESNSGKRDAAIRARKMKEMGVARGVWDYEVYIPVYDCDKDLAEYQLLKIEMKRQRGGGSTVSPEQKAWGSIYNMAGIPHKICYGAQEAIDFVKEYYKETEESPL
jgi:hypothetical protein